MNGSEKMERLIEGRRGMKELKREDVRINGRNMK